MSVHTIKPPRIARLPVDQRGFPVPWFVQWFTDDGKRTPCEAGHGVPDFRCADQRKFFRALSGKHCWLCGEQLGVYLAFVIGPMCAVSRVTSEPPCHLDCATYAVRACPFLTHPRRKRDETDLPDNRIKPAGIGLSRNPGAACIWVTRSYQKFRPTLGEPGVLLHLGDPLHVLWFAEGQPATRAQIGASIESGLPELMAVAERQGNGAPAELLRNVERTNAFLPRI